MCGPPILAVRVCGGKLEVLNSKSSCWVGVIGPHPTPYTYNTLVCSASHCLKSPPQHYYYYHRTHYQLKSDVCCGLVWFTICVMNTGPPFLNFYCFVTSTLGQQMMYDVNVVVVVKWWTYTGVMFHYGEFPLQVFITTRFVAFSTIFHLSNLDYFQLCYSTVVLCQHYLPSVIPYDKAQVVENARQKTIFRCTHKLSNYHWLRSNLSIVYFTL